ncbi:MAG TPA: ATP-grasp domain-containing protein [Candidatus Dormibacteraeota bacterium]|nr:ATP-grasp domain-containing protein [Candidatus Dormibacteraeota bacterium]
MKNKLAAEFPNGKIPGAIILGGNFLGLGIARSLGSRGVPVWVIDSDKSKSIAQFSQYTKRFIVTPEPAHEVLLREGRLHDLQGWVLFCGSDDYVEELSTYRDALSKIFHVTTPSLEVTHFALDKKRTYARAAELGIAAPWTWSGNSLMSLPQAGIPYPVILKPAVNHHFFPQTNVKALAANNAAELYAGFAQMSRYIPPSEILVQERIPGNGENQFSFCGICSGGQVTDSLVARRRRQFPIDFGNASTFVETTEQPVVESGGRKFLESIGFDGMGEVEFKYDTRDGKYKILDVNSRPWGWHTLGKAAGVDFSYLLWRQRVGLPAEPAPERRPAAWIREITDAAAILKAYNRPAEIKVLLKAIRSRRLTFATFSFFDPVPFFAEIVLLVTAGSSRQNKAKEFLRNGIAEPFPKEALVKARA